ncbi:methyltransferase family protein [Breoghania corrubedonensis]|uniref:Methyltransferase family protein n=1 Tax=Breoghania corrubedonensis TaxID=665038 RepID=A0A2T5VGH9_9HYPH|nr:class I SAM-dependent methyltransferase [Breoghania corrubedonensis]PTW62850.1 methyltransferase family protein [Breoghania corrubedonensis]
MDRLPARASSTSSASACAGLFGSGLVCDGEGEPLGPGGCAVTEELVNGAGFAAGDRVADIGCGQGRSVAFMAARGISAIGIDADPGPLRAARDRVPGVLVQARGNALPFGDGALDGILSECVLSVMPDQAAILAEWARVLRPGGRLALADVYARSPASRESACARAGGIRSAVQLQSLIAAAGLVVTRFEDRSEVLRTWVGRFIFRYGSLEVLWGDAATARTMRAVAPGYCVALAVRPARPAPTATQAPAAT